MALLLSGPPGKHGKADVRTSGRGAVIGGGVGSRCLSRGHSAAGLQTRICLHDGIVCHGADGQYACYCHAYFQKLEIHKILSVVC